MNKINNYIVGEVSLIVGAVLMGRVITPETQGLSALVIALVLITIGVILIKKK